MNTCMNNVLVYFREELKTAQDEIDRVKDEYCKLCQDMNKVKESLDKEHAEKLDKTVAEVKDSMKQEIELAKLNQKLNTVSNKKKR